MGEERVTTKLQKAESIAKIIGSVSIPVIGLIITMILSVQAEKNRQSQLFAEIMSRRESSDSDIRASMFSTLMENYLGSLSSAGTTTGNQKENNLQDLRKKVVFLKLLVNNFQEYFNAKPLFEDLHEEINAASRIDNLDKSERDYLLDLKEKLVKTARSTAKKQEIMLARGSISHSFFLEKGAVKCVTLYDTKGLKVKAGETVENINDEYDDSCRERFKSASIKEKDYGEEDTEKSSFYYSLDIRVTEIHDHKVKVALTVYRDFFRNNFYEYYKMKQDEIEFTVSYFDLPFMDNTRLFDGSRFAIILKSIEEEGWVELGVISFREEFMSLRDRPFFEEMLNKLNKGEKYDL